MLRKLLSFLCAMTLCFSFPLAQAEETNQASSSDSFTSFYRIPDTLYYKGGTVLHGYYKGLDIAVSPIEIAYAMTSSPYLIVNEPTFWEVFLSGGTGDYSCTVLLACQEDLSQDPFVDGWDTEAYFPLEGDSFEYTFTKPGRYFWEFHVMDDAQYVTFQTRIYETYEPADETDDTTVVGKVNRIVSELITEDMSDYTRALVLHDWLIYNANYDYTYTHYEAAGVLLYGSGVCDSYARAYLMLCTAAGLECMYLSGSAYSGGDWGSHGWNLVQLGGDWYHVDCTWDDPGEGGYERHTYFCLDDEAMARDHRWNRPDDMNDPTGYIPPEAEGGEFSDNGSQSGADFTFCTVDEFDARFNAIVNAGKRPYAITGQYTGSYYYGIHNALALWVGQTYSDLAVQELITDLGWSVNDDLITIYITWVHDSDFIEIAETSLLLSIGEEALLMPVDYTPDASFAWRSSQPDVATVSAVWDDSLGLIATVTGVAPGETTITATASSGYSDSVKVTVLPAHRPDFSLSAATDGSEVLLSWETIPGVTDYFIYRRHEGADTLIATTSRNRQRVSQELLPSNVAQQVYVVGQRIVDGEVRLSYTSEPITYGKAALSYHATLPAGLTAIEEEAFYGNTSLTSFRISGKVTSIGARAFCGCSSLTTIRIPASVTSIGDDAFDGCPLQYAEVSPGSYAESWLQSHFPGITLIY